MVSFNYVQNISVQSLQHSFAWRLPSLLAPMFAAITEICLIFALVRETRKWELYVIGVSSTLFILMLGTLIVNAVLYSPLCSFCPFIATQHDLEVAVMHRK